MTQQPTQAPLVAEALEVARHVIAVPEAKWKQLGGHSNEQKIALALIELARQLEQVEREKAFYHSAAGEAEQLAERYREAIIEHRRKMGGSVWSYEAEACWAKAASRLWEALSEQHERSSDLGNSVARKNMKPSGEVGEEAQ